jgi:hypothetical protein
MLELTIGSTSVVYEMRFMYLVDCYITKQNEKINIVSPPFV